MTVGVVPAVCLLNLKKKLLLFGCQPGGYVGRHWLPWQSVVFSHAFRKVCTLVVEFEKK